MTQRDQILEALRTFAEQRPGLEPSNYFCGGNWLENRRNYDNERRAIYRDLQDFRTLYAAVRWRESIDVDALKEAARAFSGRLKIVERPDGAIGIDYCTGQYFPTEYRKAACAVLASALWDYTRAQAMPPAVAHGEGDSLFPWPDRGSRTHVSAGTWLRKHFKREFGARLARRYFD